MGTMHVIRDLCQGVARVTVYAGDLNEHRLAGLGALAQPLAVEPGSGYTATIRRRPAATTAFDYTV